jgi:hypothetical protein
MDYVKKWEVITQVIPEGCNVVTGMLGPELDLVTVGVKTGGGIQALPPLYNAEPFIDLYWQLMETGETFVVGAGTTDMAVYKYDDRGWMKQSAKLGVGEVPEAPNPEAGPKIHMLSDVV